MRIVNKCAPLLSMLVALLGAISTQHTAAAPAPVALPAEAGFLPGLMKLYNPVVYEPWNELSVPRYDGKTLSGKHWSMVGAMSSLPDSFAAWNSVKAAFLAHGWTIANENPRGTQLYETLHFTQNGADLDVSFRALGIGDRLRLLEPGVATAIEAG